MKATKLSNDKATMTLEIPSPPFESSWDIMASVGTPEDIRKASDDDGEADDDSDGRKRRPLEKARKAPSIDGIKMADARKAAAPAPTPPPSGPPV